MNNNCDLTLGPCSCGAWHNQEDLSLKYKEQIEILKTDRDGARAAIEDRDKMHAEHIQKIEVARLRLEADKLLAIDLLKQIKSMGYHKYCNECDGGEYLYDEVCELLKKMEAE